jgi:uncharacterized DUF497 family protein
MERTSVESGFTVFEWDEDKRADNLRKHSVDFSDLPLVPARPHLAVAARFRASDLWIKPEERMLAVLLHGNDIVTVIYTVRGQTCRIISARPANRNEREAYHTHFS